MTALPAVERGEAPLRDPAEGLADARPRRVLAERPQAPYRRPPVVRRHRRRRMLGLLRLLVQALVIVGLPTTAAAWALTSPQFAVQEISVKTGHRIPAVWVEASLEPVKGLNLLRLSLPDARQRLESHPWLASASLRKRLPDALEVTLVEKEPVAVLERTGADPAVFVDAHGGIIAPVEVASDLEGLPRIFGSVVSRRGLAGAIATAKEFQRLGTAWGGSLERIEILGTEDFLLVTEELPFPLVVRQGSLEEKHASARRLVPEILARFEDVRAVDLRFAQKIVLQPGPGDEGLVPPSRIPSRG